MNRSVSSKIKDPAKQITFRCTPCKETFACEPSRVEDAPDKPWHPFEYFSQCNYCGEEVLQVTWEKNLFKAHANATGPTTFQGKQIAAKNLDGHPTQEETKRTRFNALKHGAAAKTATYFPARPGQYPQCGGCDIDFEYCATQIACTRRTDLMLRYLTAVESGDLSGLNEIFAMSQASLIAIFQDMITTVVKDGVTLTNNVFAFDKDGGYHEGRIEEVKAHPLLKPILDMMSKNNLSMSDLKLTPKGVEDRDIEMGRVSEEAATREDSNALIEKQNTMLDSLNGMISRAQERINADPVYQEHQAGDEAEKVIEGTHE